MTADRSRRRAAYCAIGPLILLISCGPQPTALLDANSPLGGGSPDGDVVAGVQDTNDDLGSGGAGVGDDLSPVVDNSGGGGAAGGSNNSPESGGSTPTAPDTGAPFALSDQVLILGDALALDSFDLLPTGNDAVGFEITSDVGWLTVTPAAGTLKQESVTIEIRVDRGPLASGSHVGRLQIATAAQHELALFVFVHQPDADAPFALSTQVLDFSDALSLAEFSITPAGNEAVGYEITTDVEWLEVVPAAGTLTDQAVTIDVRVDRDGAPAGLHVAQLRIKSDTEHELPLFVSIFQPDSAAIVSDEQIVAWLSELEPLPKTHYSFAFSGTLMRPTPNPLAVEYVRITRALTVRPEVYPGLIRPIADLFKQLDAALPSRPCSLAMLHSPWHIVWPKGLPPTYVGPEHDAEIAWFDTNLANAKAVIDQVNAEKGTNLTIDVFFFDSEIFQRKPESDPNAAVWNAAIDAKYDAMYNIAKSYYPDAIVDWYGRGGMHRCSAEDGWCQTNWFTGHELGDNYAIALYSLPEYGGMQESFTRTVVEAQADGYPRVTPWVSLGAGYQRTLDDGFVYSKNWDYNLWYSWQFGAEINHPWFATQPDRFAPWDMAEYVMFYPRPFEAAPWGKHFVAYVRGAHRIAVLPE